MARSVLSRAAAGAGVMLILSVLGATAGRAEMWNNPALPRSPYALPAPTYRAPEVTDDELIYGNGELHSSGQWRHWGDSRNTGEFAYDLFGPGGAFVPGNDNIEAAQRHRFCNFHPDRC